MLNNACPRGMMEEYRIFQENLSFPSFSKLMEVARHTNKSVHELSRGRAAVRASHIWWSDHCQERG